MKIKNQTVAYNICSHLWILSSIILYTIFYCALVFRASLWIFLCLQFCLNAVEVEHWNTTLDKCNVKKNILGSILLNKYTKYGIKRYIRSYQYSICRMDIAISFVGPFIFSTYNLDLNTWVTSKVRKLRRNVHKQRLDK